MRTVTATLLLFAATAAFADYDAVQEARDKAQHDATQRAQQQKQQEAQQLKQDLNAKANADVMQSKRKALGTAADGKSDAEVNRLYDAKLKKDSESAKSSAAATRNTMSQGQGDAALRNVTGKSMKDLEKMSDAE